MLLMADTPVQFQSRPGIRHEPIPEQGGRTDDRGLGSWN